MKAKTIEHEGKIYTISEIAKKIGLSIVGVRDRTKQFEKGEISFEQLMKPKYAVNENKRLTYIDEEGNRYDSKIVSKITGLTESASYYRIKRTLEGKMTKEQLLSGLNETKNSRDYEFGEENLNPKQRKILKEFKRQIMPSIQKHDKYFPPL